MNKKVFAKKLAPVPVADVLNEAGGAAYALSPREALAHFAMTGTFNDTFYSTAEQQLAITTDLCDRVIDVLTDQTRTSSGVGFIARLAIYAREHGHMKDMPAFLLAYLAAKGRMAAVRLAFPRVIDNVKMLRNFVGVIRSGVLGRKSMGTSIRNMVRVWLDAQTDEFLFRGSVGNDPSLADVISMVHPKPKTESRRALYGYLLGVPPKTSLREMVVGRERTNWLPEALPELVQEYEHFSKMLESRDTLRAFAHYNRVPAVPFEMLTRLPLQPPHWAQLVETQGWHWVRMNLNTLQRHGALDDTGVAAAVAARLSNADEIRRSQVFPYQLFVTRLAMDDLMNAKSTRMIYNALDRAMEIACENIPEIEGDVLVFPDVSGSMQSPVTGQRGTATTKAHCIHVAGLIASAFLKKNPNTIVVPFGNTPMLGVHLSAADSILTNAQKLAKLDGGGTACSAPLIYANEMGWKAKAVVYVSDNQSWCDTGRPFGTILGATATMGEWKRFKRANPSAKLICIDLAPSETVQAARDPDVLNLAGFSDETFKVIADFVNGKPHERTSEDWLAKIEAIQL